MPIEIVAAPSGKGDKQKGGANPIELMFFIVLNVLVIPFSGFQTYVGYSNDVVGHPALAFVVAAISAVLFAAMNFGIRERRLEGKPHHWQTVFYIVPLGLSFFGNFNAFYSQQMQNELYDKEITRYEQVLQATHDKAIAALDSSTGLSDLEISMETKLGQIRIEFEGKYTVPSWGPECIKGWHELQAMLRDADPNQSELTTPKTDKSNMMNAVDFIARDYFQKLQTSKNKKIEPLKTAINSSYNETDSLIQKYRKDRTLNEHGRELLDKIVKSNSFVGSKVNAHLKTFHYQSLETSDENQIGTIKHTVKSAFVDKNSTSATFFSIFLSLIIDLSALFYILLFVPYDTVGGNLSRGLRRV